MSKLNVSVIRLVIIEFLLDNLLSYLRKNVGRLGGIASDWDGKVLG